MEIIQWNGNSLVIILFNWDYLEMIGILKMLSKIIFHQKELLIDKNIKLVSKISIILKNSKIYSC